MTIANILKGTVEVGNFPATQTVDGTVVVGNFPEVIESPFLLECFGVQQCTVDISAFQAMGEVTLDYVSGSAINVGNFATPKLQLRSDGGRVEVVTVVLPGTYVSTLDTGLLRDVAFAGVLGFTLPPFIDVLTFDESFANQVSLTIVGHVSLAAAPANSVANVPEPGSGIILAGLALLLVPLRRWLQRLTP